MKSRRGVVVAARYPVHFQFSVGRDSGWIVILLCFKLRGDISRGAMRNYEIRRCAVEAKKNPRVTCAGRQAGGCMQGRQVRRGEARRGEAREGEEGRKEGRLKREEMKREKGLYNIM